MHDGLDVDERIERLLRHLGVERAHFGTSSPMELAPLLEGNSGAVSSLTVLNATRFPQQALQANAARTLIFSGDSGLGGEALQKIAPSLEAARIVRFADYESAVWTDMVADHGDEIVDAMAGFIAQRDAENPATIFSADARGGKVAGISFKVVGDGPALILFPAMLAASQWDPIIERLAQRFAVVVLGGPHIGAVAILEDRGWDETSIRALRGMLHDANVTRTDRLLEIGCGCGTIARWLAQEGLCATPIAACDLNPFLLREAAALATDEGVGNAIEFEFGDALALPYADSTFDAVISITVLEECDADKAIAEMLRVLKPGGRALVKVRACDMNVFWNVQVLQSIKDKVNAPIVQVAAEGCADASLRARMIKGGFQGVVCYPTFFGGTAHQSYFEPIALARLDSDEQEAWRAAKAQAQSEGSFFMMHPAHCAVGSKPV